MDVNLGLLIIRLAVGGFLVAHGSQKLFGWFGGHGLAGTGAAFEGMGFPRAHAALAGSTEMAGGLGLAVGLLTPLAGAAIAGAMLVAVRVAHWKNGFFTQNGGYEYPLLLAVLGVALAFAGPGAWSLDHLLGWSLFGGAWGVGALILAVISSATIVATRSLRVERGASREVTA